MSNMGTSKAPDIRRSPGQAPVGHLAKKIWERHFPFQELENSKRSKKAEGSCR